VGAVTGMETDCVGNPMFSTICWPVGHSRTPSREAHFLTDAPPPLPIQASNLASTRTRTPFLSICIPFHTNVCILKHSRCVLSPKPYDFHYFRHHGRPGRHGCQALIRPNPPLENTKREPFAYAFGKITLNA